MTASTATDATLPVSYFFDFVDSSTGGSGGTDSGWQSSVSYTDSGLQANHSYGYRVKARDSASTPNETAYSSPVYKYSLANAPGAAAYSDVGETGIRSNWTPNANRSGTQYYCENTTSGDSSGWIPNTFWDSTNLNCGTSYSFRVKAKNDDGIETDWHSLGSRKTNLCTGTIYVSPDGICAGNSRCFMSIQEAINSAASKASIKIREGNYEENILLDEFKEITLEGGYDSAFTSVLSKTTISGTLTISNGAVIPSNLIIIPNT